MTETDKKIKFNIGAFLCYTVSVLLSLVCYLVYAFLPYSDEFTNSIEYSGEETVFVFGSSFVSGLISALIFGVMTFAFRKYYYKLSFSDRKIGNFKIKESTLEWISLVTSVLLFAVVFTSAVLSFLFFKSCMFDMDDPFLAPTDGTIFKNYEYVILANTIVHIVFYILTVIKMIGIHWLDGIVCSIRHIAKKIKK